MSLEGWWRVGEHHLYSLEKFTPKRWFVLSYLGGSSHGKYPYGNRLGRIGKIVQTQIQHATLQAPWGLELHQYAHSRPADSRVEVFLAHPFNNHRNPGANELGMILEARKQYARGELRFSNVALQIHLHELSKSDGISPYPTGDEIAICATVPHMKLLFEVHGYFHWVNDVQTLVAKGTTVVSPGVSHKILKP